MIGENGLLKQLTKALLERAMSAELTNHLGYEKNDPAGYHSGNSRNGATPKTLKGDFGEMLIETPRDRNGSFEPQIIKKHQARFDGFDDKILSMYARGMTTREIQGHLHEMYGVEVSPTLISEVTDGVMEEVKAWQNRPLESVYGVVYLDALYVKMRHEERVENRAVYIAIGIGLDGQKDVLGLWTSNNEGAKFWLAVLTELKNRGVKEILIACVDGLKGFPQAIESVFPQTVVQLCIVHLVRASLNYVNWKERKAVAADLKEIYRAATAVQAEMELNTFQARWGSKYQAIGKLWKENWARVVPFFEFPAEVRKVIYTTNAVESLHMSLRKIIKTRGSFPSEEAALKLDLSGAAERHPEMGYGAGLGTGAQPLPDAVGRPNPDGIEPLMEEQNAPRSEADSNQSAGSEKWPAAARNLNAPFPVSPSGGKPGRAGSPHADSTLRGQQKALARIVRRLPPQAERPRGAGPYRRGTLFMRRCQTDRSTGSGSRPIPQWCC